MNFGSYTDRWTVLPFTSTYSLWAVFLVRVEYCLQHISFTVANIESARWNIDVDRDFAMLFSQYVVTYSLKVAFHFFHSLVSQQKYVTTAYCLMTFIVLQCCLRQYFPWLQHLRSHHLYFWEIHQSHDYGFFIIFVFSCSHDSQFWANRDPQILSFVTTMKYSRLWVSSHFSGA